MKDKNLALLAILTALVIGSAIPAVTKISVAQMPPFTFTFLRFLVAGIAIIPFFLKDKPHFDKNTYKVIIFSIFLTANVTLFPIGVKLTTATIGSMMYIIVPIIVAVLSYFFFSEKFSFYKIIGVLVGFIGALIIVLLPVITNGAPFTGDLVGNIIVFTACIGTAAYTVLSKPFLKNYSPLQLTSFFIFTTAIVLAPLALSDIWIHPNWWAQITPVYIYYVLYVGILGTTLWYLLYQYAIKHGSPLIASLILYLAPAANYFWAYFLLKEQLTGGFLLGFALACAGVYLTLKKSKD